MWRSEESRRCLKRACLCMVLPRSVLRIMDLDAWCSTLSTRQCTRIYWTLPLHYKMVSDTPVTAPKWQRILKRIDSDIVKQRMCVELVRGEGY